MKTSMQTNGVSDCQPGQEKYDLFPHPTQKRKKVIQYDYRHTDGELFSIVRDTLEQCREARGKWLRAKRGFIRGFVRTNKAYYAIAQPKLYPDPELVLGTYYPDGSVDGEMTIRWEKFDQHYVPHLSVWEDGWQTLAQFTDVIEQLGKICSSNPGKTYPTEQEIADMLLTLGFTDLTKYTEP